MENLQNINGPEKSEVIYVLDEIKNSNGNNLVIGVLGHHATVENIKSFLETLMEFADRKTKPKIRRFLQNEIEFLPKFFGLDERNYFKLTMGEPEFQSKA